MSPPIPNTPILRSNKLYSSIFEKWRLSAAKRPKTHRFDSLPTEALLPPAVRSLTSGVLSDFDFEPLNPPIDWCLFRASHAREETSFPALFSYLQITNRETGISRFCHHDKSQKIDAGFCRRGPKALFSSPPFSLRHLWYRWLFFLEGKISCSCALSSSSGQENDFIGNWIIDSRVAVRVIVFHTKWGKSFGMSSQLAHK